MCVCAILYLQPPANEFSKFSSMYTYMCVYVYIYTYIHTDMYTCTGGFAEFVGGWLRIHYCSSHLWCMLQCVAVCCSVLKCVAAANALLYLTPVNMLQCAAVFCNVLQCVAICFSCKYITIAHTCGVCYSVLQCVAVRCSCKYIIVAHTSGKCQCVVAYTSGIYSCVLLCFRVMQWSSYQW